MGWGCSSVSRALASRAQIPGFDPQHDIKPVQSQHSGGGGVGRIGSSRSSSATYQVWGQPGLSEGLSQEHHETQGRGNERLNGEGYKSIKIPLWANILPLTRSTGFQNNMGASIKMFCSSGGSLVMLFVELMGWMLTSVQPTSSLSFY